MDNPFSQPDLAAMDLAIADCLRKFNTHSYVDVDTRAFTQRNGVADCFFDVLRCQDIDALEQKLTALDGVTAFRATDKLKTLRAATVLQAIADELHLKPFVLPAPASSPLVAESQTGLSEFDLVPDDLKNRHVAAMRQAVDDADYQPTQPAFEPKPRAKSQEPEPTTPAAIEWLTPEPAQDDQPRLEARKPTKSGAHMRSAKAKEEQQNRLAKQSATAGKTDKPADEPSKLDQLNDDSTSGLSITLLPQGAAFQSTQLAAQTLLKLAGQGFGMTAIGGTGDRVGEAIEAITEPVIPQDLATDPLPIETDVPSPLTSMSPQSGTPATREVFNLQTIATFNQPSGVPSITLLPKGFAFRLNQAAVQTFGLKQAQTVEFTRVDKRLFIRFDRPAGVGFPFQKSQTDQAGFSFSSRRLMERLLDILRFESNSELPISTTQSDDGYELLLDQVITKRRPS